MTRFNAFTWAGAGLTAISLSLGLSLPAVAQSAQIAHADLKDVVSYSEKATTAATQTGKKLKNIEIAVRKMAERLRDIKRSLNFEDQPPVQEAAERLEKLRNQLLAKMFGNGKN